MRCTKSWMNSSEVQMSMAWKCLLTRHDLTLMRTQAGKSNSCFADTCSSSKCKRVPSHTFGE